MLNHLLKENGDITQGLEKLLGLVSDDTVRVGSLPVARPPKGVTGLPATAFAQ